MSVPSNMTIVALVALVAPGFACTQSSDLGSPEMAPFISAIDASPRREFGFTPLPRSHPVRVEHRSASSVGYDVMLHLAWPRRSETIAFVKTPQGYKWVSDQEIHTGPRDYETAEGRSKEQIIINYSLPDESAEARKQSGMPPGLVVTYLGPDAALMRESMSALPVDGDSGAASKGMLERVKPLIKEWKTTD